MDLTFANPLCLWLIPITLLVMGLLAFYARHRTEARLNTFAEADHRPWLLANVSPTRRTWKLALLTTSLMLLLVALARPQWGEVAVEKPGRGVELMIALDLSASMRAEDVLPNRLERARLAILDLADRLPGSKLGLIVYTREAFVQVPLTLDHQALRETLQEVDTYTLPQAGTDVGVALAEAAEVFGQNDAHHIVFVFSDGEDLEGGAIAVARDVADKLDVYTVGVGTTEGGLIPDPQAGQGSFLRDPVTNEIVRTRLDGETLAQVAAITGGAYAELGVKATAYNQLVANALAKIPAQDLGVSAQMVRIERFPWALVPAIVLLAAEFLLGTRRRERSTALRAALPLLGLLGLGLALPSPTEASELPRDAYERYQAGDFGQAINTYRQAIEENPEDGRLHYNLGNALYRSGKFLEATEAYRRALSYGTPSLQARAFYNLGNTSYELGAQVAEADGVEATKHWEEAARHYRNALALRDGKFPEASDNLAFVEAKIKSLLRTVTVAAEPEKGGTVEGGGTFIRTEEATVKATPNEDWRFAFWVGEPISGKKEREVTFKVDKDAKLKAHFVKLWDLTVTAEPAEAGTAEKSGTYDEAAPVDLKAKNNDYWAFERWEIQGEAEIVDATKAETKIALKSDVTAIAHFAEARKMTVKGQPQLGVNAGPNGFYLKDRPIELNAKAREGFTWLGWAGEGLEDPSLPQQTVLMDRDRDYTALVQRDWNLVVLPDKDENGTTTGGGNYTTGTEVPITAKANEGYTFLRWEGPGVTDPEQPETSVIKQDGDQDIIAIFEPENQDGDSDSNSSSSQDQQNQDSPKDQDQQNPPDQDQPPPPQDQGQPPPQGEQDPNQGEEPPPSQPEQPQDQGEPEKPEESPQRPDQPEQQPPAPPAQPEPAQPSQAAPAELQPMTPEEAAALLRQLEDEGRTLPAARRPASPTPPTTSQGRNW